jgi:hypothetical protein
MSAEYSMKISDEIDLYLKEHKEEIKKQCLKKYKTIMLNLARALKDKYSIKIWKLLYDYDLMEVIMSPKYLEAYNSGLKTKYKNKIFNLNAVSYFIYEKCYYSCNLKLLEKMFLYKNSVKISFEEYSLLNNYINKYETGVLFGQKLNSVEVILFTSTIYCMEFDCESDLIRIINLDYLLNIISYIKSLN